VSLRGGEGSVKPYFPAGGQGGNGGGRVGGDLRWGGGWGVVEVREKSVGVRVERGGSREESGVGEGGGGVERFGEWGGGDGGAKRVGVRWGHERVGGWGGGARE